MRDHSGPEEEGQHDTESYSNHEDADFVQLHRHRADEGSDEHGDHHGDPKVEDVVGVPQKLPEDEEGKDEAAEVADYEESGLQEPLAIEALEDADDDADEGHYVDVVGDECGEPGDPDQGAGLG